MLFHSNNHCPAIHCRGRPLTVLTLEKPKRSLFKCEGFANYLVGNHLQFLPQRMAFLFFIILLIRKLLLIEKYRNISAIHLVGLKDSKWSTLCCYDIFVVYKWAVFWRLPLSWQLAYAYGHMNTLCFFRGVDYVKKCEVKWNF